MNLVPYDPAQCSVDLGDVAHPPAICAGVYLQN